MNANCATADHIVPHIWSEVDPSSLGVKPEGHLFGRLSTNILNSFNYGTWFSQAKRVSFTEEKLCLVETEILSTHAQDVLGDNGVARFELFKEYKKGWDAGHGVPLAQISVAVMESFIAFYSEFNSEPSLFLTTEGNIQLGWEDNDDQIIEVEFLPDRIEYYIEALDEERSIPLTTSAISTLSNRLLDIA